MKKRVLSLLLALAMVLSLAPAGALAADEISVTVRFSAPGVAEDLARLRTDLLAAFVITEDDTDLPGDITVTVPSGSTVKTVLEAARAKQAFSIEGLDESFVTKIGFLDNTVAEFLAGNPSNLNYVGWSFFVDDVPLSNGIGTDTVTTDGAVVEGLFSVYNTWDNTAGAMVYHDVELVNQYHELDAMVKQPVDTSGFSASAKAAYDTAKSEAETLLTSLCAQAKLDDSVASTLKELNPNFTTDDGMWVGFIGSKGTTLYGPGSPIEQLQKAAEKLEEAAKGTDYGPCDLTALSVTDFATNPSVLTLKPGFDNSVTEYTVDAVDYPTTLNMAYVKATAASEAAAITAKLGDTTKTVTSGDSTWTNFMNKMVPGENNVLTITVTNGSDTRTYTVTIPMKDEHGDSPAPEPGQAEPSADPVEVMHAIAAKYAAGGIASEGQAPWLAADMAAYAKAFPDTANKLTDAQKQAYLDQLIPAAAAAAAPGDLAKYIIAFRAMGYDARKVTTADGKTVDVVKKLTDLVDARDGAVADLYTLPNVLVALRQGEDYATAGQMAYLKEQALAIKDQWQKLQWGSADATPPMLLALAPYYGEGSIKAEIDKAVQFLRDNQDAVTGALNYGDSASASTTGIALMGLAAVGVDSAEVKTSSGKSMIDGLMTTVNAEKNGFDNAFGTEQGFRGLVAWLLAQKAGGAAQVFDFADMPMNAAHVSATNCPVSFSIIPDSAAVEVRLGETVQSQKSTNYYDLPAGTYTYTVTRSGYRTASGTFEVTAAEAAAHTQKTISVSLVSEPGGGGETENLTIRVKVLAHDGTACGGKWTYKNNADQFTVKLVDTTVTAHKGQTAFDAFALAMEQERVAYTEGTPGYISEIGEYEELGHAPNAGWQYMIGSTLPTVSSRDYVLRSNVSMTWFYTDDYTAERGSEQWGGGSAGVNTEKPKVTVETGADGKPAARVELPKGVSSAVATIPKAELGDGNVLVIVKADGTEKILRKSLVDGENVYALVDGNCTVKLVDNSKQFHDTEGHWAKDAVAFAASHELFRGTDANTFSPNAPMDRAMLATVLYRLEDAKAGGENPFADVRDGAWYTDAVTWANANEIVKGTGTGFEPTRAVTRQELAVMLYRYAKTLGMDTGKTTSLGNYADGKDVAGWADEAMGWAVANGLLGGRAGKTLAPNAAATRAEAAVILQRLVERMVK